MAHHLLVILVMAMRIFQVADLLQVLIRKMAVDHLLPVTLENLANLASLENQASRLNLHPILTVENQASLVNQENLHQVLTAANLENQVNLVNRHLALIPENLVNLLPALTLGNLENQANLANLLPVLTRENLVNPASLANLRLIRPPHPRLLQEAPVKQSTMRLQIHLLHLSKIPLTVA